MEAGTKRHIGLLEKIESGGAVRVKIARNQCDGCKLGDLCSVSADDELEFECESEELENLQVGDRVIVEEKMSLEWTAICYCLFVPFVLFFVSVVLFSSWYSVLIGVVSGIFMLSVYYGIFYMFGNRFKFNKVKFGIRKI